MLAPETGVEFAGVPATSSCARRAMAAPNRCLQNWCGALLKSGQEHTPAATWYVRPASVCEPTVALPSPASVTSPARTSATAFSTRLLLSGSFSFALAATAATASRQAGRCGSRPKLGDANASQLISVTIVMVSTFFEGVDSGKARRHFCGLRRAFFVIVNYILIIAYRGA